MIKQPSGGSDHGVKGKLELDTVKIDSPHGIYIYDPEKDKWILLEDTGKPFKPWKDGYYIIYFDNTKCPACRIYDLSWYVYVKLFGRNEKDTYYVVILCDWFAHQCRSEAARKSFKEYDIHASPTTMLLYVENGEIKKIEKVEGAKTLDKLAEIIAKFKEK